MSFFPETRNASFSQSQLNAVTGDQFIYTNCTFDSSGPRADNERQAIADWLSPLDFSQTQNEIYHRRAEGTGLWLLESKEFEKWRNGSSGTLFCPGMPGAGKTALVSIVINHLQIRFGTDDKAAVAYVYLDYKKQTQQSLTNLVSSLLKQLIQIRTCPLDDIKTFCQQHTDRNTRPTLDDLTKALNTEISKLSKVFVIVDAVDELTEDNGVRADLLTLLRALSDNVNVMVTSRHIDSIAVYFQNARRLEIRAHDEDVRKYILGRIPPWYSKHLAETVTEEIVKKAGGMFLLARLHMDSLLVKHSPAKVTQALKKLPRGMDHTYDEAMNRIQRQDGEDCALAYRVLSWIVFAYRPLSVEELRCALAVSPGMTRLDLEEFVFEECLTSYCAGLVIIDEESRITRLVHYTTQEYFENRRERLFPDAQTSITRICLTYLMFDEFEACSGSDLDGLLFMNHHPLLEYAALYWGRHASGRVEEIEKPLLLQFLQSHRHVALSGQIMIKNEFPQLRYRNPLPALHLCGFFGLCHTMKHLLGGGEELNLRDGWGRTPLSWAAYKGHDGIVSLLLGQETIDINVKDEDGWTPLLIATEQGQDGIVSLLLWREDIHINTKGKDGRTPLSIAAVQGHDEIASLLLRQDAIDINTKDNDGWTPLSIAAVRGHSKIVSLLLGQKAIDINVKDKYGRTPLSWAAVRGHNEIVNLLVGREAIDINAKDEYGRTALSFAVIRGHVGMASLLLGQEGIDINTKDKYGRTPLSWAAVRGRDAIVSLLLEHDNIVINSIFAQRQNKPTSLPTMLSMPHTYKILSKPQHLTRTRWVDNQDPKHISFPAHGSSVVTCLLFSRGRIISASDDHSIHVYSPITGELLRSLDGHEGGVWTLAASKDILVSGSTDRTVRIWNLSTGRCTHVFGGHSGTVRCLAIVKPEWIETESEGGIITREKWPKRSLIVTGSRDRSLRVWALPRQGDQEYRYFEADDAEVDPSEDVDENPYHKLHLEGHDLVVRTLAARGRLLVSGSYDCTVRIWDIITGECKWVLVGHTQKVYSVVLDLGRNQACSGSMDGTVRVWNLRNGQARYTLAGHTSLVGLLGLSPSYLVSAAADSTLRIWDPDTGELRHTLAAHTGAISCFQHDEFKVLSGSDGTLKMWNIRDGSVVRDLLTSITGVWQVVFEGRWCIAASNRTEATVLDVWDFGLESDEEWVDEPPGGIYDDGSDEEDDHEQVDFDAMDQNIVQSIWKRMSR